MSEHEVVKSIDDINAKIRSGKAVVVAAAALTLIAFAMAYAMQGGAA